MSVPAELGEQGICSLLRHPVCRGEEVLDSTPAHTGLLEAAHEGLDVDEVLLNLLRILPLLVLTSQRVIKDLLLPDPIDRQKRGRGGKPSSSKPGKTSSR